jgi:hypothetical protein
VSRIAARVEDAVSACALAAIRLPLSKLFCAVPSEPAFPVPVVFFVRFVLRDKAVVECR